MIGRNSEAILRVDYFAVGVAGPMGDPRTGTGEKDRFERSDKTAGGDDDTDGFILVIKDVHIWLAIRDDEERLILQLVAHADAQTFSCPKRCVRIAETRLLFRSGSSRAEIAGEMRGFMSDLVKDFPLGKNRRSM